MIIEVKTQNLNKAFLKLKILANFNYTFNKGSYAIIGRNGTGKSTLLKLLTGAEKPDSGDITVNHINLNKNPENAKRFLAYVPDQSFIYPFITGHEFLKLVMKLRDTAKNTSIDDYVALFELSSMLNKPFSAMSLGTQKKFMLTAALHHNPSVLIMDEPTNGLDTKSRQHFIDLMNMKKSSSVIVYATHDEDLIQDMSSTVINLNNSICTL